MKNMKTQKSEKISLWNPSLGTKKETMPNFLKNSLEIPNRAVKNKKVNIRIAKATYKLRSRTNSYSRGFRFRPAKQQSQIKTEQEQADENISNMLGKEKNKKAAKEVSEFIKNTKKYNY